MQLKCRAREIVEMIYSNKPTITTHWIILVDDVQCCYKQAKPRELEAEIIYTNPHILETRDVKYVDESSRS